MSNRPMKIAILDGKRRTIIAILRRFHQNRPDHNAPYSAETSDHGLVELGLGPIFYVSRVYNTPYSYQERKHPCFEISANDWSVKFKTDIGWYASHVNLPEDFRLTDIRLIGAIESMDRDLTVAKMLLND